MGGPGGDGVDAYTQWIEGGRKSANNPVIKGFQNRYKKEKEQQAIDQEALASIKTPSLSDKAIQDAILAERNRSLAGQSRTAAFAVRDQRKMYTGA